MANTSHNQQSASKASTTQHRRRGKELEADILASTLNLIEQTKYEEITMDMIAKRAHTNKSVLYRRWDSKADIVLAALRTQTTDLAMKMRQTPNTGSLEGDLRTLFDWICTLLTSMHYANIIGLMRERLGGISMRDYFDKFARKNFLSQMVRTFFEHASERGEVDLTHFDEVLYDLPALVLMDAFYATDDTTIDRPRLDHILSDILMPVYRPFLKAEDREAR
ncbi:hypothetical protein BVJ53_11530 [Lacticaseibacillus chiayiensis]|uniref:TetR/AcrR family transcriptional regulator n=1 Tax=Lacticaseibacillus chiayiensis TaxID=2100821 RepID=A0A4Q1TLR7_9LACO|nr:TetR/AcrR family transcriptional regulator [Lacticaseibacillus chiayiensis]QVI34162.1 TetR/AcrR family transcriptional regulator [Lacticaseibacillus chiayiensis]RXT19482.1 hypothetical protein BVJ53_11530 [Lacticaseibacillus chiayiensis]UYN55941.1 TetR/AcrR family transcriptional regulator [Lacticaseibacillus chiayiensis]